MFKKTILSSTLAIMLFSIGAFGMFAANSVYADVYDHYPSVSGAKITDKVTGLPPGLGSVVLNNRENLIYLSGYNWANSIGNLVVLDGATHKVINRISSPTLNTVVFVDEETNTIWGVDSTVNAPNATVTQYDSRSLKVIKTFPLSVGINEVTQNRQTGKYYATSNGTIEVFDKNFNHLTSITGDDNPNYVAVNENTNKIYVTNYWDVTVTVIDGRTDTIVGNPIPVGTPIEPDDCYTLAGYPYPDCNNYDSFGATDGIAVDPDTNRIFAANPNTGTFVTIDGKTNTVISTLQLQEGTFAPATLPGLDTALVVNWDRSTLSVVDEATHKLTDIVQVGAPDSPNCLRIQWDGGNCAYWGDLPVGIAVSPDNQKIYVLDSGDGQGNPPATDPHADSKLVILKPTFSDNRDN